MKINEKHNLCKLCFCSCFQVTANVIAVVDNVLQVDDDDYEESVVVEAPTSILDSLEDQITLYQTQGEGDNLTMIGERLGVVALQLPESSLDMGLGFATLSSVEGSSLYDELSDNMTMVYFNSDYIPLEIVDAAIELPNNIRDFIPPDTASKCDVLDSMVAVIRLLDDYCDTGKIPVCLKDILYIQTSVRSPLSYTIRLVSTMS